MKRVDLMKAANRYYPDGYLSFYFDEDGNVVDGEGDSLAKFIVIEIYETYDEKASDEKQVAQAIHVLKNGIRDLEDAIAGIAEDTI
jgi:hypothetical protein